MVFCLCLSSFRILMLLCLLRLYDPLLSLATYYWWNKLGFGWLFISVLDSPYPPCTFMHVCLCKTCFFMVLLLEYLLSITTPVLLIIHYGLTRWSMHSFHDPLCFYMWEMRLASLYPFLVYYIRLIYNFLDYISSGLHMVTTFSIWRRFPYPFA